MGRFSMYGYLLFLYIKEIIIMKINVAEKKIKLPCGRFCDEGLCGDCIYLDLSKRGSSGRYYCSKQNDYMYPSDSSKYKCSYFRHR